MSFYDAILAKNLSGGGGSGLPSGGTAGQYLVKQSASEGDADWKSLSAFAGATSQAAGEAGLVPAPAIGDDSKVLFGDGSWGVLPSVDLSVLSNDAFQFSTDEKPVGMWIDRKILYAKTVTGTVPNGSAWFDIAHGISNIDKVCFSKIGMVSGTGAYITIGGADDSYSKLYGMVSKTNIGLCIVPNNDYKGYGIIATIFYTKTTDSPLSADEKFAGVTSGGEVIYEQDVTVNNFSCSQGAETQIADLSSASIDKMIYCFGTISESSWGSASIPELGIRLRYKDGKLYLKSDGSWSSSTVDVTIRYTKTS